MALIDGINYSFSGSEATVVSGNKYEGDIIIPSSVSYNGKTYVVAKLGDYCLADCTSLTNITIPNSITSLGDYCFINCTSLTNITIPNSVTSLGSQCFIDCTSLINITIPNSVTSLGVACFQNCTSLTNITIPNSVTSLADYCFINCTSLTNITIPNSVTSIGVACFSNCTSLTNNIVVNILNHITSIEVACFEECTSLTNITIPNSVTSLGVACFQNCTSLTNITIPNSVTSLGDYCFRDCTSLTNIIIPDSVTSIADYCFRDCTSLINITIPNSVTSLGVACFQNCTSLTNITIPNSVTSLADYCFIDCTSLTNITIPDSVISLPHGCFSGCTSLTNITIPNSVTSIEVACFQNCTSLTNITIPNSVTSIGSQCFRDCTSLTNITIPNSVTSIGISCFYNCSRLIWIKLLCNESLAHGADGNYIKDGRHREVYNNEIYYVKDGYSIEGLLPKIPINIQYSLSQKKIGDKQTVTWDSNGNTTTTTYDLYFYQNNQWVAINSGLNLNYTHTIPTMENSINAKYRVRACLNGLYSDWCEGGVFSVKTSSESQSDINVKTFIDDMMISFEENIILEHDYSVSIQDSVWDSLDYGSHTITIYAYDNINTSERIYTFDKCGNTVSHPTISGKDSSLGSRSKAFSQSFYVNDEKLETILNTKIYINNENGIILGTINNSDRNKNYNIEITQDILNQLELGVNKIIIKLDCIDGDSIKTIYRYYSFYKDNGDNYVPIISGLDSYLGTVDSLIYKYTVEDQNIEDILMVKTYLNGKMIDCIYNAKRGFEYYIYLPSNTIKQEDNIIEIVANDTHAITRRMLQFKKNNNKIIKDYDIIDLKSDFFTILECKKNDDLQFKVILFDETNMVNLDDYEIQFNVKNEYDIIISYNNSSISYDENNLITIIGDKEITKDKGVYKSEIILIDKTTNQRIATSDLILKVR